MKRILAAVALLVVASSALADFTGRVINVSDGDSLTVLFNKTQAQVRLDGIDGPESKFEIRQTVPTVAGATVRWQGCAGRRTG